MTEIRGAGDLATLFLNHYFPDDWARQETADGFFSIDSTKIESLTLELQSFIAEVVASILDAGSEREVVLENQELTDALTNELKGWIAP